MATTEALNEYRQLLEQIGGAYRYGQAFAGAVLIAITTNPNASSRNSYIRDMGKHFGIDSSKINRIIELLPD